MAFLSSKIQPDENNFSQWFSKNWNHWCERFHPGIGSGLGIPDRFILTPIMGFCQHVPIELKIGFIDEKGILWSKDIRPSQISWHTNVRRAKGLSFFLVGIWQGKNWQCVVFDGKHAAKASLEGLTIGKEAFILDTSSGFTRALQTFIENSAMIDRQ